MWLGGDYVPSREPRTGLQEQGTSTLVCTATPTAPRVVFYANSWPFTCASQPSSIRFGKTLEPGGREVIVRKQVLAGSDLAVKTYVAPHRADVW